MSSVYALIVELNKKTLKNYVQKSLVDYGNAKEDAGADSETGHHKDAERSNQRAFKRVIGIRRATNKLAKEEVNPLVDKSIHPHINRTALENLKQNKDGVAQIKTVNNINNESHELSEQRYSIKPEHAYKYHPNMVGDVYEKLYHSEGPNSHSEIINRRGDVYTIPSEHLRPLKENAVGCGPDFGTSSLVYVNQTRHKVKKNGGKAPFNNDLSGNEQSWAGASQQESVKYPGAETVKADHVGYKTRHTSLDSWKQHAKDLNAKVSHPSYGLHVAHDKNKRNIGAFDDAAVPNGVLYHLNEDKERLARAKAMEPILKDVYVGTEEHPRPGTDAWSKKMLAKREKNNHIKEDTGNFSHKVLVSHEVTDSTDPLVQNGTRFHVSHYVNAKDDKEAAEKAKQYHGTHLKDVKVHKVERLIKETKLIETLSAKATAADYIKDFVHSKNKMFKNDSKKQRIKRALAAYYSSKGK